MDTRTILVALAILAVGCESPPDDAAVTADPALRLAVMGQNFDDLPVGPLGDPWVLSSTAGSTATVVESPGGTGNVLYVDGDDGKGAMLVARVDDFSEAAVGAELSFDVEPTVDSRFVVELRGAGPTKADEWVDVIRGTAPDFSEVLYGRSRATGRAVLCGELPSDQFRKITLRVDTDLQAFDVDVDGVATACSGLPTAMEPPFESMSVIDSRVEGWGGGVTYDNFYLVTDSN